MTERNLLGSGKGYKLLKAEIGARSYLFSPSTVSRPLDVTTEKLQETTALSTSSIRNQSTTPTSATTREMKSTWSPVYESEDTESNSSEDPTPPTESNLSPVPDPFAVSTTPQAQMTTSSQIPVSNKATMRIPTNDPPLQIFTTASTQHSSSLPLPTLSTTYYESEEILEVEKSMQTPTRKTGAPRPSLESNETGDGLANDYRESTSLKIILILMLVLFLVLCGTVIVWLTLRMRRKKTSLGQNTVDNRVEMSVFLDDPVDDNVGPENSNTVPSEEDRPENPEGHPEPLISAHYEESMRPGNTNVGKPSEPDYDEVCSTE
ncbi:uncharacterized protein LOC135938106 [Cloeon dipterum]|uniref:uncharacterized protein LOC135938106 n=1 Tax=Cloeon dipterum TaxID=197152 RepID=UPI003220093A